MKYILTPTEKGVEKDKERLECSSLKQAQFVMSVYRGSYELENNEE